MLRYYNTADRAFNRNLHDLRKLQKERKKEEIGFVPQITFAPPVKPLKRPKPKTLAPT